MPLNRIFTLNNGYTMPALGLGTWRAAPGQVRDAVRAAINTGYRHIDCAYIYENEAEIGEVFAEGIVPRESLFITSKLWNTEHNPSDVPKAIEKTLSDLRLQYLDLYLIHWPISEDRDTKERKIDLASIKETWKAMEGLVDAGKTKSIGVSNFTVAQLTELLKDCRIKPAVNQVELHPYLPQNDLVDFCKKNGIVVTAYSPLGSSPGPESVLSDPEVEAIAKKKYKTAAQVLISWAIQRGTVVIPKSSNKERIQSNFDDFLLSDAEMKTISDLHITKGKRFINPKSFWGIDLFEDGKELKLSSGYTMPALGLGTWRAAPGQVRDAVRAAINTGYRHIDCAYICMVFRTNKLDENEAEIGEVFAEGIVPRESLFITSKLWNTEHNPSDVPKAIEKTLSDLRLQYLDLYLIHWPISEDRDTKERKIDLASIKETWKAMEGLVDAGKTKSIGVSNFTVAQLTELLKDCRIKPAVNQVELHPYLPQNDLVDFCKKNGIVVTAYSPLGSSPGPESVLNDSEVEVIAKKHNSTTAQVLISWAIQRGTVVIPKSSNPGRIESNSKLITLSQEDMAILNQLHLTKGKRYVDPKNFWDIDVFGQNGAVLRKKTVTTTITKTKTEEDGKITTTTKTVTNTKIE